MRGWISKMQLLINREIELNSVAVPRSPFRVSRRRSRCGGAEENLGMIL